MAMGMALGGAGLTAGLSACARGADGPSARSGTPRRGGRATVLLPGDARGLDPFTASYSSVADGNRLAAIYDVLVWADPATGTVRPRLAESLTSEPGAREWTLTLRQGLRFSDGSALDAAAVLANWEAHRLPETGSLVGAALRGARLTVLDPLRMRIQLSQGNANFDRAVARDLSFIAPRAFVETADGRMALRRSPVGAGPFKLKHQEPGRMVLERNRIHWEEGRPFLDEVVFTVDREIDRANELINDGEADLTISTDPLGMKSADGAGLVADRLRLNGGLMLAFNLRRPPFNDVRARRAVVLALSADEISRRFYGGAATPALGLFSSGSPLANINLSAPDDRPDEAAKLFAALTSNGRKRFVFRYLVPDSPRPRAVADYIRSQVEKYPGVTMTTELVDIASLVTRTSIHHEFDATVYQLWADDVEPTIYQFLHGQGGPANVTGYDDPVVNEALTEGRRETDPEIRRAAYTRVQLAVNRDLPFWVYAEAVAACVHTRDITGVRLFNDGLIHFGALGRHG